MVKHKKKEHDFAVTAFRVVQEATGQNKQEKPEPEVFEGKNPLCPYCKQDNVIKYGTHKTIYQRYWCKFCRRKFTVRTKIWQDAKSFAILCRQKKDPFCIIQQRVRSVFEGYNMPDSTLALWIKPLFLFIKHRGRNTPSYYGINITKDKRTAEQIEYEHECALAGNTGISIIDELTKDIRNLDFRGEVRQQVALECLIIGLDKLNEEAIRAIIKKAIRKYKRDRGDFKLVSLYSKKQDSERTLLETIADPNAIDPLDLLCDREKELVDR